MTITVSKFKLAISIVVIALLVPAAALASDAWSDVEEGRFYHDAVAWAKANGMTTGCNDGTGFCPNDGVTRGENITFAKRYDDLVVQPALGELEDDLEAATVGLFDSDTSLNWTTSLGDLGLVATVTIPAGHTGVIELGYSAESACYGVSGYCIVEILVDGVAVGSETGDFAFDSSDRNTETAGSWESHAMTRVTDDLPAGTYVATVTSSASAATPTFWLDDMTLTAEVHLTS